MSKRFQRLATILVTIGMVMSLLPEPALAEMADGLVGTTGEEQTIIVEDSTQEGVQEETATDQTDTVEGGGTEEEEVVVTDTAADDETEVAEEAAVNETITEAQAADETEVFVEEAETETVAEEAADDVVTDPVAKIGETGYATLLEAVAAAVNGDTIVLQKDAEGDGIALWAADQKTITINLNSFTYTVNGTLVGSTGTENQAFHFEKGNTVTIKNGTLKTTNALMLIQNYCDLTLEDVTVDGTGLQGNHRYVVSNNNGSLTVKGDTDITAKDGDIAFDVWYSENYSNGVAVTFDDSFTGTVTGDMEYGAANGATEGWESKTSLTINGTGTFTGSIKPGNENDLSTGTITVNAEGLTKVLAADGTLLLATDEQLDAAVVTIEDQEYTGSALTPEATVLVDGIEIDNSACSYRKWKNNTNVGDATVIVSAYDGKIESAATFDITAIDLSTYTVNLSGSKFAYTGEEIKPTVTVTKDDAELSSSLYTVTYASNTDAGAATVTVAGDGTNVVNEATADFDIVNAVATIGDEFYNTFEEAVTAANAMTGDVTIELVADATWTTGASHGSTPLVTAESAVTSLTINGNGKTLTAVGEGVGSLRAANGGVLNFKDMTIKDESVSYKEDAWEFGYLEFGGKLNFTDVDFVNAIMLTRDNGQQENCEATFTGCTFNSNDANQYDIWVSQGDATFTECTFTGYRGAKIHEAYGSEVDTVTFTECAFEKLSKKPGLAVGDVNEDTTVIFDTCSFDSVQAGDQGLYVLESDTPINNYTVNVKGTALVDGVDVVVAKIGSVGYVTLDSAFAAAKDGETIEVVKDTAISSYTWNGTVTSTVAISDDRNITLDLAGHKVTSELSTAFNITKGNLTVVDTADTKGGINVSGEAFRVTGSTESAADTGLTISEGVNVSSTGDCCVYIRGLATLNTAGNLTSSGDYCTIQGNGNETNNGTVINITGGTITQTKEIAIYVPQNNTMTISGGTITGATAVYTKAGNLKITGGTLTGTGAKAEYSYNGSGCNATGDALVIDNCGYPSGAPTVTVSGGNFGSANADPIGSYAYGDDNSVLTGFVSVGYFSNATVDAYAADGKHAVPSGDDDYPYTIGEAVASITTGDTTAYYTTLKSAVRAAADGDTVVLLADTAESFFVPDVEKSVTIDLGGNTMTGWLGIDDGPVVTVANGTIAGTVYVYGGAEDAAHNGFTLADDAVIESEDYGLILKEAYGTTGPNGYGSTVNIDGTVDGIVWVMGNIQNLGENPSTINVNGGAKVTGDDVGVALNGAAVLNVAEGASVTGTSTGIEVRAGKLNVAGGTITGQGEELEVKPNGSGTTTSGAGIAVAQHTTALPIVVSVSGGTIKGGGAAFSVANPQDNADNAPSISVSGGYFSGDFVNDDDRVTEGFVSGGYFSNDTVDDCAVAGKHAVPSGDDDYPYTIGEAVASITTGDTTAYYGTLKAAVQAAADGDTVVLLADTAESFFVPDVEKSVTIDLGGNTMTGWLGIDDGPVVTVANGTIAGTVHVYGGSSDAAHNGFTLASDATISSDDYGLILKEAYGTTGPNGYGSTVNINGTVNGIVWVMGNIHNLGSNPSTINVNGTAKVTGDSLGIALNGAAVVNVAEGAEVTGASTGIEVRAGKLSVAGGTVTGRGDELEVNPNGSGTTTSGAGIAVAQHTTALPIEVSVSGGTVSGGGAAFSVANPQNNVDNAPSISVSGGYFSGDFKNTDNRVSGFVSGGYFSNDTVDDCAVAGKNAVANTDTETMGLYPFVIGEAIASVTSADGTVVNYTTLPAAVAAAKTGETVTLLKDASGAGIFLAAADAKSITIDLSDCTYTVSGPAVGSTGTATQGLHAEKGNAVTLKNGTFTSTADSGVYMLVQNYCDLTLEDVTLDGTSLPGSKPYTLSNNCGEVIIGDGAIITAKDGGYAFDVCSTNYYPDGAQVTVADGATINGNIELGVWGSAPATNKATLTVNGGAINGKIVDNSNDVIAKKDVVLNAGVYTVDPSTTVEATYPLACYPVKNADNKYEIKPSLESQDIEVLFEHADPERTYAYTGFEITPVKDVKVNKGINQLEKLAAHIGEPITDGVTLDTDDYTVAYTANINAGTATATITGTEGSLFAGTSTTREFKITKVDLATCTIDEIADVEYTGKAHTPEPVVKHGKYTLVKGTDYTVSYTNNTNVGEATVTITAVDGGNFTGTNSVTFNITSKDLSNAVVTGIASMDYTGQAIEQDGLVVTLNDVVLNKGTDYTVAYEENVRTGQATLTITGTGNYSGSIVKTFAIHGTSINTAEVTIEPTPTVYTYDGEAKEPTVTSVKMTINGKEVTLVKDKDYTVQYINNVNAGTAQIVLFGIADFSGGQVIEFTINKATVTAPTVSNSTYDGTEKTGVVAGTGYVLTGDAKATNAGDYIAIATLSDPENYTWDDGTTAPKELSWSIAQASASITIGAINSQVYNGTALEPAVTVTTTPADLPYELTYSNNVKVGEATVKATITDPNYTAEPATAKFDIVEAVAEVNGINYASLQEAIAAVPTDGTATTVRLLTDITKANVSPEGDYDHDYVAINGNKNVVLDMDGKSLTTDFMYVLNGSLEVMGGTVNNTIYVYGLDTASTGMQSVLKVDSDATIASNFGVILYNLAGKTAAYDATIDIDGTVNGIVWVMGNITEGNSVINVNADAQITGDDVGIGLNGMATVNIHDGASVTGTATGIEARSGNLNVYGGTITGQGTTFSLEANGNGTTTSGAGIAIAQHTTKTPVNVNVYGGDISGYYAVCASDPQNNGDFDNVNVTLTDGTFRATGADGNSVFVAKEGMTITIKGGAYSDDNGNNYNVPEGKFLAQDEDGLYRLNDFLKVTPPEGMGLVYNGSEQTGVEAGEGYTLSSTTAATEAGGYTAIAKLADHYAWDDGSRGDLSIEWTIAKAPVTVTADDASKVFGATDPTLTATVGEGLFNGDPLAATDYTVARAAGEDVGTYAITVTDAGTNQNYVINGVDGTFTITPAKLPAPEAISDQLYTGQALTPTVVIKNGEATLTENTDYTVVSYLNNTELGEAAVIITGAGNYTGMQIAKFNIVEANKDALKAALDAANAARVATSDVEKGFDLEPGTAYVTSAEQDALTAAIDAAQAVYDDPAATDEEIADAANALNEAVATYKSQIKIAAPSKEELKKAIDDATAAEKDVKVSEDGTGLQPGDTYVPQAAQDALDAAQAAAQAVYDNPNATPEQIAEATENLNKAIEDYEAAKQTVTTKTIDEPTAIEDLVYNGSEQTGVEDGEGYSVENNTATDAGTYKATATLDDPETTTWPDGTTDPKTVVFEIGKATEDDWDVAAIADQTYTGSAIEPALTVTLKANGAKLTEGTDYEVLYTNNTDAGTATVVVVGKGNLSGTKMPRFTITPATVEVPTAETGLTYTGDVQTGVKEGDEYKLSGNTGTDAGDYTATVKLADAKNYTWTDGTTEEKSVAWTIGAADASKITVADVEDQNYTGSEIKPTPVVTFNGKVLTPDTDFTFSYENNTNVGEATITVTAKSANFTGSTTKTFKIVAGKVEIPTGKTLTFTGAEQTGVDTGNGYTLSGNTGTDASEYTATAKLADATNFTWADGTTEDKSVAWKIEAADISALTVSEVEDETYTGSEIKPTPEVKLGSVVLTADKDYALTYADNVNAGKATITVTGKGNVTGTKDVNFTIKPVSLTECDASVEDQPYTKTARKPVPTVTYGELELVNGTDFTIKGYENNIKPGYGTVTIEGKGNYVDSVTLEFIIRFKDVPPEHEYYEDVHRAASLGLVNGYSGAQLGNFGPEDSLQRCQVAVMLWNLAGKPAPEGESKDFKDIKGTEYYASAVAWASSVGVVNGYSGARTGYFGPTDPVQHEELCTMVANYAKNIAGKTVAGTRDDFASFSDAAAVKNWAVKSVGFCFSNGLTTGFKGKINPQGEATRAETASMVYRLYLMING